MMSLPQPSSAAISVMDWPARIRRRISRGGWGWDVVAVLVEEIAAGADAGAGVEDARVVADRVDGAQFGGDLFEGLAGEEFSFDLGAAASWLQVGAAIFGVLRR
jgi:hypothetical protein